MDQKNCPQCGAQVDAAAKFCPECGVPLQTGTHVKGKGVKAPTKSSTVRDTLIVVGVLAVVGAGYFLLKDNPPPPAPPSGGPNSQSQSPANPVIADTANPHGTGTVPMAMLDNLPKDYNTLVQMANHFHDSASKTGNATDFAVASEIYRRALDLNGSDPNVRVDYGACLHGMGLPQRAAEEFAKVLAADPKHAIANFNMGVVQYSMDHRDSAKIFFKNYLRFDPQGAAAQNATAFLKELGG